MSAAAAAGGDEGRKLRAERSSPPVPPVGRPKLLAKNTHSNGTLSLSLRWPANRRQRRPVANKRENCSFHLASLPRFSLSVWGDGGGASCCGGRPPLVAPRVPSPATRRATAAAKANRNELRRRAAAAAAAAEESAARLTCRVTCVTAAAESTRLVQAADEDARFHCSLGASAESSERAPPPDQRAAAERGERERGAAQTTPPSACVCLRANELAPQ